MGSVYYIQTRDIHLGKAWEKLYELIGDDAPVIIESGGIKELLDPGLSIVVTHPEPQERKNRRRSVAAEVETRFGKFDLIINKICFEGGSWQLKN